MSDKPSLASDELSIHGALILDKPIGVSSAKFIARIKRRFRKLKVGHAGTLDPAASGVLVVLLGKATRLQDLFLNSAKRYSGEFRLGVTSATIDMHEFWKSKSSDSSLEQVAAKLRDIFSGKQQQTPPSYSAVSKDGVRSYKAARKGNPLELSSREVEIEFHDFSFISNDTISYDISVSKGTYVRSLARDIGEYLGCGGLAALIRRERSGSFCLADAAELDDAELSVESLQSSLLPMEYLASSLPKLELSGDEFNELFQGRRGVLDSLEEQSSGTLRAIYSPLGRFSGLLEVKEGVGWAVRFLMEPPA
ncbi:UNVERIFIED_CONTAM: hypothetical protein GTU68_031155 [Idotea baltica]|nr:hypothetical protein [Idotea baltica]